MRPTNLTAPEYDAITNSLGEINLTYGGLLPTGVYTNEQIGGLSYYRESKLDIHGFHNLTSVYKFDIHGFMELVYKGRSFGSRYYRQRVYIHFRTYEELDSYSQKLSAALESRGYSLEFPTKRIGTKLKYGCIRIRPSASHREEARKLGIDYTTSATIRRPTRYISVSGKVDSKSETGDVLEYIAKSHGMNTIYIRNRNTTGKQTIILDSITEDAILDYKLYIQDIKISVVANNNETDMGWEFIDAILEVTTPLTEGT